MKGNTSEAPLQLDDTIMCGDLSTAPKSVDLLSWERVSLVRSLLSAAAKSWA